MATLDQAPHPAPGAPGFWWRVLSPPSAVLAAFAALIAAGGVLSLTSLGDESLAAILAFVTSLLLLVFGLLLWRNLPAHDQRVSIVRPARPRRAVGAGVAAGLGLLVSALVIVGAGAQLDPAVERRLEDVEEIGTAPWQLALMITALVVMAPLGEELLFRVLLLRGLARRMRFWPAAVVSACAFTAAHIDAYLIWPRAIALIVTGVGLAWLYRRRGYWAAVTAHGTVNAIAAVALVASS